jgi:hypothetical protein
MRARIALTFLILAALTTVPRPAAAGPWGLGSGQWGANLEGSTFTSNTFHPAGGGRADSGLTVEQRALVATTEIGLRKGFTLVFALPAMSVTRRDAGVEGTATGFQDLRAGLRWNLMNARTAMALEVGWSGPTGYNRHLDSLGLHLGDGLQELSGGLALGTAVLGRGFLQGSLGYGYRYLKVGGRAQGPVPAGELHPAQYQWSNQILASADLAIWATPSILVGGRYQGRLSLSAGPLAQEVDAHLAGPVLLYRVDDRLDVLAGSWSTVSGKNTPHVDQVYVGMAFHKTTLNRLQGFLGSKQSP